MQCSQCRLQQLGLQEQVSAGISCNAKLGQHQVLDLLPVRLLDRFNNLRCVKLAVGNPQFRGSGGDASESEIMHGLTYPFYNDAF
ncbi:hypothetical protein D3C73_991600 [compost metagenome]